MTARRVFGSVVAFSLVSMMIMILGVMLWATYHDYVMYDINEVSRELESNNVISSQIADDIEGSVTEYTGLINYFDWMWLLSYVIFFGGAVALSYFSKDEGEFGFLGLLLYGIMIILFLLAVITTFTDWLSSEILYKLIPNLSGTLPKFDFYMNNVGMFSFIHLLLCIFANKLNLNLDKFVTKKKFEDTNTGEVL